MGGAGSTVSGNETFLGDWTGEGAVGEYHIRLHAIGGGAVPAPGALALVGVAGLLRRRRR
jgi:MYXO-CTERM domain-containing protein